VSEDSPPYDPVISPGSSCSTPLATSTEWCLLRAFIYALGLFEGPWEYGRPEHECFVLPRR